MIFKNELMAQPQINLVKTELNDKELKAFLDQVRDAGRPNPNLTGKRITSPRRKSAQARIDIAKNDYSPLVYDRIVDLWETKSIQDEIKKHAKMTPLNAMNNITQAVTTAYNVPPNRTLLEQPEDVNNKFSALLEEGMITIAAKQWLEMAFITNVVIVVPTIKQLPLGPKLIWDLHLPNNTEIIPQLNDPTQPAIMGTMYGDLVCVLDSDAWFYYDKEYKEVGRVEHGLEQFPGTAIRIASPMGDFWDETRGNNVVAATIDLARLYAELSWIRKSQSRKIPVVIAEDLAEDVPVGQVFHPEQPFEAQTKDPQNFKFEIKDFDTSVDEFIKHSNYCYAQIAESFGIHSTTVDLDSSVQGAENTTGLGQAVQHSKLAEIREDHIQWLRMAEKDLMYKTARMAEKFDHPLKVDPAMVKDTYNVVWGPLSFVDHPQTKVTYQRDRIALGVMSPVDIVLEDHPNWSREQAMKWIEQIIEEKSVVAKFHAEHNLASDQVDANMDIAQKQGQQGGLATKPKPEEAVSEEAD